MQWVFIKTIIIPNCPYYIKKGTNILLDSQVFLPIVNYTPNSTTLNYGLTSATATLSIVYIDGQRNMQYAISNQPKRGKP